MMADYGNAARELQVPDQMKRLEDRIEALVMARDGLLKRLETVLRTEPNCTLNDSLAKAPVPMLVEHAARIAGASARIDAITLGIQSATERLEI